MRQSPNHLPHVVIARLREPGLVGPGSTSATRPARNELDKELTSGWERLTARGRS